MTIFNSSRLAHASAPLFTRFFARNFWPLSPIALAAMLEQLEPPGRRNKLQLSGIQPGCSVLLCDETQQCQWLTLVNEVSDNLSGSEVALLSPLGVALVGRNVGDEVRLFFAGRQCHYRIAELVRVRRQPGNPKLSQ